MYELCILTHINNLLISAVFKIRILLEWIWYLEIDEFDSIGNEILCVTVCKSEFKSNIAN